MAQTLSWTGQFLNFLPTLFFSAMWGQYLRRHASTLKSFEDFLIFAPSYPRPLLLNTAARWVSWGQHFRRHVSPRKLRSVHGKLPPPSMCAYFPSINGEQNVLFSSSVWSFYFHVSEAEWCMSICCASSCGDANLMHMHTLIGDSLTKTDIDRRSNTIEKKAESPGRPIFGVVPSV